MEEAYARDLRQEINAVKSCRAIREAMELAGRLRLTSVPDAPEDEAQMEAAGIKAEDPYDWATTVPVADGDWPGIPTARSLAVFAEDDAEAWSLILGEPLQAQVVETVLNGDYLFVPIDREPALPQVFWRLHISAIRDDGLMAELESDPD